MRRCLHELEKEGRDGADRTAVPESELACLLLGVRKLDERGQDLLYDPFSLVIMICENL
jgi:hypothetical protein